jgi:hypothetical protein
MPLYPPAVGFQRCGDNIEVVNHMYIIDIIIIVHVIVHIFIVNIPSPV